MNKNRIFEYKYTERCGFLTVTTNIRWKSLLINIAIPLAIGGVASLITNDGFKNYSDVVKPTLSPPSWVFPVVWTVLYVLMGISTYLIYEKDKELNKSSFIIYAVQLALNFFWPIVFFGFNAYFLAFIILLLLIVFVIAMIINFYRENRIAGLLQIPYLIWLIFAAYLNLAVFLLN